MGLIRFFALRPHARDPALGGTGTASGDQARLLSSLLAMAWVVEARDPYTGGHLWRVARYAALLCERAGTPPGQCARVAIGGFLHDLGKVGIPDATLRRPRPLSNDDVAVIKTHPEVGARLIAAHPLCGWVHDAVHLHHERPDGRGYPRGLRGAAVPFAAQVIGICDAFDAMTSTRPYRAGVSIAHALEILEARLGQQFDEALGRQFIALGSEGLLGHIAERPLAGAAMLPIWHLRWMRHSSSASCRTPRSRRWPPMRRSGRVESHA